jgi:hypothetical protein
MQNKAGKITKFINNNNFVYIAADVSKAYERYGENIKKVKRHLLFIVKGYLFIWDDIICNKSSKYEFLLHSGYRMKPGNNMVRARNKNGFCDVLFLSPDNLRYSQTNKWIELPKSKKPKLWHLRLSPQKKSKNIEFLTIFYPHKRKEEKIDLVKVRGILDSLKKQKDIALIVKNFIQTIEITTNR